MGPPNKLPPRHLLAFFVVGAIGFAVDGGLLTLLGPGLGWNIYLSRLLSFACAVTVTWALNRTLVFGTAGNVERRMGEYSRYFVVQCLGALLNLATFAVLIAKAPSLKPYPIIPLAAGSLLAMLFNYTGSRAWVFRRHLRP